MNLPAAIRQY